jgi:hypothetical protein
MTAFKRRPKGLGNFKRCMQKLLSSPELLTAPSLKDAFVRSLDIVKLYFSTDIILGILGSFFCAIEHNLRLVDGFNDEFGNQ